MNLIPSTNQELSSLYDLKITADKVAFIPSKDIRVFPCGWRGKTSATTTSGSSTISFDQEARLNTEFNLTHLAGQSGGLNTYVIDNGWPDRTDLLCFYINGYYFEIRGVSKTDCIKPISGTEDIDSYIYASIRITKSLLASTAEGSSGYDESTYVLSSCLDTNILDVGPANASSFQDYVFTGLALTTTPPAAGNVDNQFYTIQLFDVIDGGKSLILHPQSKALPINHGVLEGSLIVGKYNTTQLEDELFMVGGGSSDTSRYDALIVGKTKTFVNGLALEDVFEPYSLDKTHLSNSMARNKDTTPAYSSRAKRATAATYLVSAFSENGETKYKAGDGKTLVYFNNGVPTASSTTLGSTDHGVYLSKGVITELTKPGYLDKSGEKQYINLIPAVNKALSGIKFDEDNRKWTTINTFSNQIVAEAGIAAKNTSQIENLIITGQLTVQGKTTQNNTASIDSDYLIGGKLTVGSENKTTSINVYGTIDATSNATIGGTLTANTIAVTAGGLSVSGNTVLSDALTVSKATTLASLTASGTTKLTGTVTLGSSTTSLTVAAKTVSFTNATATFSKGITVSGASTFSAKTTFTGDVYVPDVEIS